MRRPRICRSRSADGCTGRGHRIGNPCRKCDRAEAVDDERDRREEIDPTDDGAFMRSAAAATLEYVARERRAWRRNRLRGVSEAGLRPMDEWGRSMLERAAWYRNAAARVVVLP